ncbi:hypothetical protein [Candidatus Villigracilis affinis]|uniref:hypothetical protein n=1 Tax=Candidatus Villigracilis affinis TaxID=3140682 RepID=UPI0031E5F5CC
MTQIIEAQRDRFTISTDPARLDLDAILDFSPAPTGQKAVRLNARNAPLRIHWFSVCMKA